MRQIICNSFLKLWLTFILAQFQIKDKLPTIMLFKDGVNSSISYYGPRNLNAITNFLEEKLSEKGQVRFFYNIALGSLFHYFQGCYRYTLLILVSHFIRTTLHCFWRRDVRKKYGAIKISVTRTYWWEVEH